MREFLVQITLVRRGTRVRRGGGGWWGGRAEEKQQTDTFEDHTALLEENEAGGTDSFCSAVSLSST